MDLCYYSEFNIQEFTKKKKKKKKKLSKNTWKELHKTKYADTPFALDP